MDDNRSAQFLPGTLDMLVSWYGAMSLPCTRESALVVDEVALVAVLAPDV